METDPLGLAKRVVLVTGAGRGYGRQLARAYGSAGATVIAVDPDVELATQVASEVEALGASAIPIRGDLAVSLDVTTTFEKIDELFGVLDGIVHVASGESQTPFTELLEAEWHELLNADVKSSWLVLQHGLKYLAGGGFVVLVLPPAKRVEPHVAAVRGAVLGLIQGASAVFPEEVRVNGVIPSRDPAGEAYDRPLIQAVLGLGSAVSQGIHGETVHVRLPEPPTPPELYDLLADLP